MADRIGQQLGHYRLTRLLGRGGFAEVYLGEHIDLGTQAASKILHTRVVEEDVALFRQEARLLASLRHPHIVRVLDFGVSEEQREFREFLDRLRFARDKTEFDQFMSERRARPASPPPTPQS